jgi:Ca2+-binding RTX toxin-like protein
MPDTYEAARAVIMTASSDQFLLPEYLGGTTDQSYLRNWVLGQVTEIYGVPSTVFDDATVYSTSILRDFVHRALYQTMSPNFIADLSSTPEFLGRSDVAMMFRYPAYGLCGDMARQQWEVFRAFGYCSEEITTINGDVNNYTDSHVTTQVYVNDLQKYIVQDATFNFLYRDEDGAILSFYQARELANTGQILNFDGFANYRWYYYGYTETPQLNAGLQGYFRAEYLDSIWWWYGSDGQRQEYLPGLFADWGAAHDVASNQGGVFIDEAAALAAIDQYDSQGWTQAAQTLRGQGYYVSGFAFGDGLTTYTSQWLTVRLASGEYISVDMETGVVLLGSLDQLMSEATGGTINNPGADLSLFLNPFYLLAADGTVMRAGGPSLESYDRGGTDANDRLTATAEFTRLFGFGGNDTLYGAGGASLLVGGKGDDKYFIGDTLNLVIEKTGEGYDTVITDVSYTLSAGSEIELLRTYGSATMTPVSLSGNEFANTIVGNDAANTLDGKAGADTMWGYGGDDRFFVDNIGDRVVEAVGGGYDTVITSVSYTLTAGSEIELLRTYGSALTSPLTLVGNEFNNIIAGNDGANTLDGKGGADTMWGYGGDDRYFVDNIGDRVVEAVGGGYDTVITDATYVLNEGAEVELLRTYGTAGTHDVNLFGNEFNNIIAGNDGRNVLGGGGGNDTLWGYGGADTFFFFGPNEGADVIADFTPGEDKIAFSRGFNMPPGTLAETGVDFVLGAAATSAAASVVYNASTGGLYWDVDGSGSSSAVLLATLANHAVLKQSDFFIV